MVQLGSLPPDLVLEDSHAIVRTGADLRAVLQAQEVLGVQFPSDYIAFLLESNGAEFQLGETCVILHAVEELVGENEPDEDFPAYLRVFGSNGGSEKFAFDCRHTPHPIVVVPHYNPDEEDILVQGLDLTSFLRQVRDGKTYG